jgi:hypothetical protein
MGGAGAGGFHLHWNPAGSYWQQHRQKHSLPSSLPFFGHLVPNQGRGGAANVSRLDLTHTHRHSP